MSNSGLTLQFDKQFSDNYEDLLNTAKSVTSFNDAAQDILHEAYYKVRSRIERSGFTGNNFMGYCYLTIQNSFRTEMTNYGNRNRVHFDDYSVLVEHILQNTDDDNKDTLQYRQECEFLSKHIFQYVEKNYNPKQYYVFSVYFTTKKSTYNKISKQIGYSVGFISETISKIKRDLRQNFIKYLKETL